VIYWINTGCMKHECYGGQSWMFPCPSHMICANLNDLNGEAFCPTLEPEQPKAVCTGGTPSVSVMGGV
jgi:hypothetical protein